MRRSEGAAKGENRHAEGVENGVLASWGVGRGFCPLSVAQPPYGAPDGPAAAQSPVGDGPFQLDPERRAARQFLRPAACGELQTTGKPRRLAGSAAACSPARCVAREFVPSSPWPAAAGGGSGRMSRPSGRRPSSCDQCGSTAATKPRRCWSQPCWPTAMDGELGACGRAARTPGRSAGCRGGGVRPISERVHRD